MQVIESREFLHFQSPHLAMACAKAFPMIAQLGVESGGRLKRHAEYTLLKPGLGGVSLCDGEPSFDQPCAMSHVDGTLTYQPHDDGIAWRITWPDDRTFVLTLSRPGKPIAGECFALRFDPASCPPSVWGRYTTERPFPRPRRSSIYEAPPIVVDYQMPLLVHLPDYGGLTIASDTPGVQARQTFTADPNYLGLNLGCTNTYHHTSRVAYHQGVVSVSFIATEPTDQVQLVFRVDEEHYPQLPGVDLSDPKWNGLKRCWQNAFTFNGESLSMGDNILLGGIAHLAIHFKSDMSLFTPPLIDSMTVHDVLGGALAVTFGQCVGESGEIHARHADPTTAGPDKDFGFFDANVSNLIALYNYTAATGDWSIVRDHLDNVRSAGRFLMALDQDDDGILELPYDGNCFRDDRECRNWWDNFSFGHKDGYINLLAYRAFGHLAEMLGMLGCDDDAAALAEIRSKFAASFHPTFFNPQTGVHAGWISADGRMHDYMFTFISSMAINQGLIDQAKAREILNTLLAKLRDEGYGQWRWGIPGPLMSVTESDGHIWDRMQRWGSYENGGFCGQTAYHFIQALYQTNMREEADEILFTMLDTFENEFTHNGAFPGYLRSCDWRTREGIPCGYNYLADNYYFLLAAITGHFGIPLPGVDGRHIASR